MFVGRFGVIIPVMAIAGSLVSKRAKPASSGTLPTHGPLFVGLLIGTVLLVGALTFIPCPGAWSGGGNISPDDIGEH